MKNKYFLLFLLGCFFASGCSQNGKKAVEQPSEKVTTSTATDNVAPALQEEKNLQKGEEAKDVLPATTVHEPISDVEDAYEEGAAQAEEDRLAGHPGMNYADDYEDDDENEAYEEGYEDE